MTTALAFTSPSAAGAPWVLDDGDLGPHEVRIAITHCGICHTDVHLVRDEWHGASTYPMVPGHEIVGSIVELGSAVTARSVGDRVGVSTYVDSCRECPRCEEGLPQYCTKGEVLTYNDHHYDGRPTYGGFRTSMAVDQDYVVPIPDAVPSEVAGPLMCAGTTVWSPLRAWSVAPGTRVGVVGLGGLGHLAVLLAASLGSEVTVLSRSRAKEDAAARLGATRYATLDEAASLGLDLDLVINTVGDLPDVGELLAVLAQDGTWVDVGVPTSARQIRWDQLAAGRRRVTASKIGSLDDMRSLLQHVATTGIRPDVTVIGADRVGDAFDTLAAGAASYRFVLDVSTLPEGAR